MSDKLIYTKHISPKKVSWKKVGPDAEASQVYERTDKLARIYYIEPEYTVVVPTVDAQKMLSYRNLGPFTTLKKARRAAEAYLHDEGFVVYREDVKNADIRPLASQAIN